MIKKTFALFLISSLSCATSYATDVSGAISTNTTWNIAGNPYNVVGNVTISAGVTLTIDPGVTVKFNGNYKIESNGTLNVQGTAGNLITFTSNSGTPAPGNWDSLTFHGSSNIINYAIIEYANRGVYIPSDPLNQAPTIQNSIVRFNNTGIYLEPSTDPIILNNVITNNTTGIFAGCNQFTGCTPQINNNSIHTNSTYNLQSFNYGSNASGTTINAENNWWGTINFTQIENSILHFADNGSLAHVDFVPYLDGIGGNPIYPAPQLNTAVGLNQRVSLAWNPVLEASGYKIHYGTSSGNYTTTIDVGNVLTSVVTGLIPGTAYYFAVSAYSGASDWPNSNELSAVPTNVIVLNGHSAANRFFDPKENQSAQINYTLDYLADVTVQIFNFNTQALVRTLVNDQPRSAGVHQENFDGKDDSAQFLPPGIYIYKITATNGFGGAASYDPVYTPGIGPVLISPTVTPAENFSAFKGDRLIVSYRPQHPVLVSLNVRGQNSFLYRQVRDAVDQADYWDGRDASGHILALQGPISLEAQTETLPENHLVIKDIATLDISAVRSDPYLIRPLYNESTQITYAINEPADVTVSILSEDASQTIRVLEQSVARPAGSYSMVWDGKTATGETVTAQGDYRVRVRAVSLTGDVVVRDGNIRVLY